MVQAIEDGLTFAEASSLCRAFNDAAGALGRCCVLRPLASPASSTGYVLRYVGMARSKARIDAFWPVAVARQQLAEMQAQRAAPVGSRPPD